MRDTPFLIASPKLSFHNVTQMLLWPDPRPLVERLGTEFFRQAPECAGVYLMRDAQDAVLYVGKARNLRQRLRSYRVANPDWMPRRHLRLLRLVARIELREQADEAAALASEAELLRRLRPHFNRAGTWPGKPWYLFWRVRQAGLELAVKPWKEETAPRQEPDWTAFGPIGSAVIYARAALVRLLWCALQPGNGLERMPEGWFRGQHGESVTISHSGPDGVEEAAERLRKLFAGGAESFAEWIAGRAQKRQHPFELAVLAQDLETVTNFVRRNCPKAS